MVRVLQVLTAANHFKNIFRYEFRHLAISGVNTPLYIRTIKYKFTMA